MREQFTFYRSFWEAAKEIEKPRDRLSFLEAVIAFALDEEEREVTKAAKSSYILCVPTLISSAKKSKAGKTKSKQNQNGIKTESNADQTRNKKEKEKENKKEKEVENECYKAPARFVPPTLEAVKAYCDERQNHVDAQHFVDFYASKGWKVGNQPMKDWRAAVRTWERTDDARNKTAPASQETRQTATREDVESMKRFLERLKAE